MAGSTRFGTRQRRGRIDPASYSRISQFNFEIGYLGFRRGRDGIARHVPPSAWTIRGDIVRPTSTILINKLGAVCERRGYPSTLLGIHQHQTAQRNDYSTCVARLPNTASSTSTVLPTPPCATCMFRRIRVTFPHKQGHNSPCAYKIRRTSSLRTRAPQRRSNCCRRLWRTRMKLWAALVSNRCTCT